VRGKIAAAVSSLDDDSRSLRARVGDAALQLVAIRREDFGGNEDAWATYTAFLDMTTTRADDEFGSITRTTISMTDSQAHAAADLLRRLAVSVEAWHE
jgi:hypothetical protein